MGVNNHIIFTGFVNNTDKIISSLDVLIASSTMDAFGRTIVEAMLQKTTVLAAKFGGHTEIINNGVNGILYNPNIENDFMNKLTIIINDKYTMSENAYRFANESFSNQVYLTNILPVYNHILKN